MQQFFSYTTPREREPAGSPWVRRLLENDGLMHDTVNLLHHLVFPHLDQSPEVLAISRFWWWGSSMPTRFPVWQTNWNLGQLFNRTSAVWSWQSREFMKKLGFSWGRVFYLGYIDHTWQLQADCWNHVILCTSRPDRWLLNQYYVSAEFSLIDFVNMYMYWTSGCIWSLHVLWSPWMKIWVLVKTAAFEGLLMKQSSGLMI